MASQKIFLGALGLALTAPLMAQDDATDPAQAVDVKSRVQRTLKSLIAAPSFECEATTTSKANPIMRQMGGGKTQKKSVQAVRETIAHRRSHRPAIEMCVETEGDCLRCDPAAGVRAGRRKATVAASSTHAIRLKILKK